MEGGTTMGKEGRSLERKLHMISLKSFWGLRPWKRHSLILMVAGILYMLVGVTYITDGPTRGREISLALLVQYAPIQFWGLVFLCCGALSVVSARWPPFTETWGYMVLTGLSTLWSLTYLAGMLFFKSPATYITQSFLWGMLAFMWWAISGLLNPDKTAVTSHGSQ